MNIGHNGQFRLLPDGVENFKPLFNARAAVTGYAAAVGLVEAGLVDDAYTGAGGNIRQTIGDIEADLFCLDYAGAGHKKHRGLEANLDRTNFETFRSHICYLLSSNYPRAATFVKGLSQGP